MGRFARSQEREASGRLAQPVPSGYPTRPEARASLTTTPAKPKRRGAKVKRLFWALFISVAGLACGWVMARAWMKPPEVAFAETSPPIETSKAETNKPGEEDAQSAGANPQSQAAEQSADATGDQSVEQAQEHGRAVSRRPAGRIVRARGRSAAGPGPVRTVLRPFKAINPMNLRRLRFW